MLTKKRDPIDEIAAGSTAAEALVLIEFHMGFNLTEMAEIEKKPILGPCV